VVLNLDEASSGRRLRAEVYTANAVARAGRAGQRERRRRRAAADAVYIGWKRGGTCTSCSCAVTAREREKTVS
jgi:hypothetical protein